MSAHPGDQVTAQVVNDLWIEAIEGRAGCGEVNERVEALMSLVSAETPVVNFGMLDLHDLTRSALVLRDDLIAGRAAWLLRVERYDADPEAWMRRYFLSVLNSHAEHV